MTDHELHLLACIILDNNVIETAVLSGIQDKWFDNHLYKHIWNGMVEHYNSKGEINFVWISDYLRETRKITNTLFLSNEISQILLPEHEVISAVEIMRRNYQRKELSQTINNIQRRINKEHPDMLINELVEKLTASKTVSKDEKDVNVMGEIIKRLNRSVEIPTGFPRLDFITKGIEGGALWMIGGYTSNGKTAFVLNIAVNIAKNSNPVTIFTTEMNEVLLTERLATMFSGVNRNASLSLTQGEKDCFLHGVKQAQDLPIHICYTMSLSNIRLQIQKKKSKLYIVDYIQMILPDKPIDNEVKRLGYIVRELEVLSKAYDVCIIATSQFHRLSRDQKSQTPTLSSFRGSGEIEENTDIAILLFYQYQQETDEKKQKEWEKEGKDRIINMSVKKNRLHGIPCSGNIMLEFNRKNLRMNEVE